MTVTLFAFALLGTLVPRARAFMGILSVPHPTWSRDRQVHMFERRLDAAAAPVAIRPAGLRQRGAGRLMMASEEVEDFEMDTAVDTEKLEVFGTIITEVKMEGRVPASSHLVYDCSHGEWLLAQMAYDRKIRLFSSRSVRQLGSISSWLPENSRFIFSGALVPKQIKRLLKMRGLSAVVARDAESVRTMDEALDVERKRLAAKSLSRISPSRERFLLEKGGGDKGVHAQGPVASLVTGLRVFVRLEDGHSVDEVAEIVETIGETRVDGLSSTTSRRLIGIGGHTAAVTAETVRCRNISVVGLWAGGMDADNSLRMLEAVRAKTGIPNLRVAMEHFGPTSAQWFKNTSAPRRGPVMWTFNYEF